MPASRLIEVDRGWDELEKTLRDLHVKDAFVKVGVLEGQGAGDTHEGGVTNAGLAAIHEFGAPKAGIPPRPWISSGIDKNREKLITLARKRAIRIYENKDTVIKFLDQLGAMAADSRIEPLLRFMHI